MAKDYKENSPRTARKNKPNQTQSIPAKCKRRWISGSDRQRISSEIMGEERHGQGRPWCIHGQDDRATFQRRHSAFRTIRGGICWGLIGLLALSVQLLLLGYQPIVNRSGFIGIFRFLRLGNIIAPTMLRKALQRFHHPLSGKTRPDLSSRSIRAQVRRQEAEDRRQETVQARNSKHEIRNPRRDPWRNNIEVRIFKRPKQRGRYGRSQMEKWLTGNGRFISLKEKLFLS